MTRVLSVKYDAVLMDKVELLSHDRSSRQVQDFNCASHQDWENIVGSSLPMECDDHWDW